MNLNDTSGCFNDYLSIEDNGYEIERFCGRPSNEYAFLSRSVEFSDFPARTRTLMARNRLKYLLSSSNRVHLNFISDEKFEADGFALSWAEVEPPGHSFDCSFDFGLCDNWIQDKYDDVDFNINYGSTASPGTGPDGDVGPNGVGGYVYLEASAPTVQGDEAQLISPFIFVSPENIYCLSFWYHIHGNAVGALQIFLTERGYRTNRKLVWSRTGAQPYGWNLAEVPVRVIYPNYIQGRVQNMNFGMTRLRSPE